MKLKRLLNFYMYRDKATVTRYTDVTDGAVDDFEDTVIYTDIPCKLSQYGKDLALKPSDMAQEVEENLRLTCDPAYDIQPNDYVVVQHQGQEFRLNASKAFKYPTHQEISLVRTTNVRDVGV